MAGRKLARRNRSGRAFPTRVGALSLISLVLCFSSFGQALADEPASKEPSQWKASIERPTRSWDYDGARILGHIGNDICLWDATTGKLLHRMKGHNERIYVVQFSPDGHHALSSSWIGSGPTLPGVKSKDTSTILWNLGIGRKRDVFRDEVAGEFSPDGKRFSTFTQRLDKHEATYEYTNPETGEVRRHKSTVPVNRFDNAAVWETHTGRQLVKANLDEYSGPGRDTLHFSPDGRNFVKLGGTTVVLYETDDGREIARIGAGNTFSGRSECQYTSAGTLAFVDREKFRVIDIKSGRAVYSLPHGLKRVSGFAWTHDGSKVAVIGRDEAIQIWDIVSGKVMAEAEKGPYGLQAAVVSPDDRRLAIIWSGSERDEQALSLYDINSGKELTGAKLPELAGMIGFSPDSKTLLIGGSEFVIFDAGSGEKIRTLKLLDDADVERWSE